MTDSIHQLLSMYTENVSGKKIKNYRFITDFISYSPLDPTLIDTSCNLYAINFLDGTKGLYILMTSTTSQTVMEANADLLEEYFPSVDCDEI